MIFETDLSVWAMGWGFSRILLGGSLIRSMYVFTSYSVVLRVYADCGCSARVFVVFTSREYRF